MRVLVAHNFYQQPGGEDQVFASEVQLLRRFGHEVATFEADNDAIDSMGRIELLRNTLWNRKMGAAIGKAAADHRAEVVHFHNTFPLISPAAYAAAHDAGAAVVQTLHNFRLLCPNALLFRDGKACELCLGKTFATAGIIHKCYRGSRSASAAVAALSGMHRLLGTWRNSVDAYIALAEFARQKFIAGGLPADRLFVKSNFLDPDPGPGCGDGGYALFVGRLSEEKGISTLLSAWRNLSGIPLKIIGDGPMAGEVKASANENSQIQWLGRLPLEQVVEMIGRAAVLVFPSNCYENFARVIVEAYAKGTPVIASRHGPMPDIVPDGKTGRLFTPGDAQDLARTVREMMADGSALATLRANAREAYCSQYTGEANHEALMEIYRQALARANGRKNNNIVGNPLFLSPGTLGEGQGGGSLLAGNKSNANPLPSPPPEYRERENKAAANCVTQPSEQVRA